MYLATLHEEVAPFLKRMAERAAHGQILRLIDDLSSDHRHPYLLLEEGTRRCREKIAADDGEVGELAGLDGAAAALLEAGPGAVEGEAAQCPGEGQTLRWIHAAVRGALLIPPRGRAFAAARMRVGFITRGPRLPGSSLCGSSLAAPGVPSARSAESFTERTVRRPP